MLKKAGFFFIVLLAGFVLGHFSDKVVNSLQAEPEIDNTGYSLRRQGGFTFINPLLECEIAKNDEFTQYVSLQHEIDTQIDDFKQKDLVSDVSVYFRDLNNGPWFGISEKEEFSPASLLKIPTMISYYKHSEDDPELLTKKIKYEKELGLNDLENIKSDLQLEVDKEYTVDELIARMIIYSDNNAREILDKNLDPSMQKQTYADLGLDIPGVVSIEDFTSVKNYASFFRILYNSTYLNNDLSEEALEMLSRVEFKEGIPSGVPEDVIVAHKFGERNYQDTGVFQLHDCGIVYHKRAPYILCIMTRGKNINDLTRVISSISSLSYKYVDKSSK